MKNRDLRIKWEFHTFYVINKGGAFSLYYPSGKFFPGGAVTFYVKNNYCAFEVTSL